jgi:hypothetical protein
MKLFARSVILSIGFRQTTALRKVRATTLETERRAFEVAIKGSYIVIFDATVHATCDCWSNFGLFNKWVKSTHPAKSQTKVRLSNSSTCEQSGHSEAKDSYSLQGTGGPTNAFDKQVHPVLLFSTYTFMTMRPDTASFQIVLLPSGQCQGPNGGFPHTIQRDPRMMCADTLFLISSICAGTIKHHLQPIASLLILPIVVSIFSYWWVL